MNLQSKKAILTGLSSKLSRVVPTKMDTAPQISSVTRSEIVLMSNFPEVNLIKFIVRFGLVLNKLKLFIVYPPLIGGITANSSPALKSSGDVLDSSQYSLFNATRKVLFSDRKLYVLLKCSIKSVYRIVFGKFTSHSLIPASSRDLAKNNNLTQTKFSIIFQTLRTSDM